MRTILRVVWPNGVGGVHLAVIQGKISVEEMGIVAKNLRVSRPKYQIDQCSYCSSAYASSPTSMEEWAGISRKFD